MDEFDFARNVTVGQYIPGTSVIHRIDARAKIIAFIGLLVATITQPSYIANVIAIVAVFLIVRASGIPLGYVASGVRPVVPLLILYLIFNFLFLGNYDPTGSAILWRQPIDIGPDHNAFTVTDKPLRQTGQGVARVVDLILLASVLPPTT